MEGAPPAAIQALLQGTRLAKGLHRVGTAIADYDFDLALERLREIKR